MITLIDLGSIFWRVYHATKSGHRAYDGTIDDLAWYRQHHQNVIVCADSYSARRKQLSPAYKANRPDKQPEAIDALERVETWAAETGRLEKVKGHEADDVIATLTEQAAFMDSVRIVTPDKDLYQLVNDTLDVKLITRQGEVDEAGVVARYKVKASQIADWLALSGDAADGIVGCPRVGAGKAAVLLQRFGSLDGILSATDEEILSVRGIGDTVLSGLREWDPTLARELVRLELDVDVQLFREAA